MLFRSPRQTWIPALLSFGFGCVAGALLTRRGTRRVGHDRMGRSGKDVPAELVAAEAEMESVYQNILVQCLGVPDINGQQAVKLSEAQKAWVSFSEAHLSAIYPEEGEHGPVAELRKASIRAELTRERTRQLREWWE